MLSRFYRRSSSSFEDHGNHFSFSRGLSTFEEWVQLFLGRTMTLYASLGRSLLPNFFLEEETCWRHHPYGGS